MRLIILASSGDVKSLKHEIPRLFKNNQKISNSTYFSKVILILSKNYIKLGQKLFDRLIKSSTTDRYNL